MDDQSIVREWLISLLDRTLEQFTSEVDEAMQKLWENRESAVGECKNIIYAFEAVLEYRKEEDRFSPYYFEQQDRLRRLWNEVLRRVQTLANENPIKTAKEMKL